MTDFTDENWKPIPGFEGLYSASDFGRIRSEGRIVPRIGRGTLTIASKIIKTPPTKGYPRFNASINSIPQQIFVHQAVLLAFVGKPESGQEVRHKNGDRSDARLCNLEYGTRAENISDAKKHGTFPLHERRPGAKITRDTAKIIAESEASADELAAKFGVKRGTIQQIRRGETWAEFTQNIRKEDYYLRGEKSSSSVLTSNDAIIISQSKEPQRVLAAKYGVTPRAIWSIKNGHSWKHVTGIKKRCSDPS
jgi:hypothetical protein